MKKIILFIILLIPIRINALYASSYIVMDQDSLRVLEGSNIHNKSLIASISKIMTCIVAIEYGDLEKEVMIDESILKAYGSGIYIQIGEELTLDDLLYGLMLRSGNDAALAIATAVSGNEEAFVYLMNMTAEKIGMKDTVFVNPSGLEESDGNANKSTTYDMAILMSYAMQNEDFRRITATKNITIKSSYKTYNWSNKNKLLQSYEYCTGGKTGYTEKAHRTLVTTATKDGMNLIVVTFNDGNDFDDHKSLYEKYFKKYHSELVIDKNKNYGNNVFLKDDFKMVVNNKDMVETKIIRDIKDDSLDGSIVGEIQVLLNNELVGKRYLYYKRQSVTDNKSLFRRIIEFLEFWRKYD